jgi:hypothetical protein
LAIFGLDSCPASPGPVALAFESRLEFGSVEPVMKLKRPGPCWCSLTTLLGMEATAPVAPEVPWAREGCVNAGTAAAASTKQAMCDFILAFPSEIVSKRV